MCSLLAFMMKIVLLFALILCAYAAENNEKKIEENDMQLKDKRQTQEGQPESNYRLARKQEQAPPVQEEPQEDDKNTGRVDIEEYRPGQVFSLNPQELLELQPERKAPFASGQQLQQLYANPQPEHKQNLQPFYYLDPQLAGQVSLQPSHAVIARPNYFSNGGEASVGAALAVSDTGRTSPSTFDQELLAFIGHTNRQEEQRQQEQRQQEQQQQAYTQTQQAYAQTQQAYTQTQQPLQISPHAIGQQYPGQQFQQVDRYITKPSKKPTKLRPKVQVAPTQASTVPQQYLIETTNVQQQQQQQQHQPLQNQYRLVQPQRTGQTLRYIPIQATQSVQQALYDRPESQGLKIVPAPNLQNLHPQTQNNYVFVPQYQSLEGNQKQYRFADHQSQQIQAVRQEQPRVAIANVERPLTYLKRFPEPEKTRAVKIYNQAGPEGVQSAPQSAQIAGEQYHIRPLYRSNEQRGRYELTPLTFRSVDQARAAESAKAPHSTIYVTKNLAPKKALRPALRSDSAAKPEQSPREQSFRVEQPASTEQQHQQASAEQHTNDQRVRLPPPKNNKAYTPEEFAALVAAGYSVTPIPVGNLGQQVAQSRSSLETIQIPQRRPLYNKRHQYLPLRSDEAP